MSRVNGMSPVRPNGLVIRYIEVDGGALDTPYISEYPADDGEFGSGSAMMETEYTGYSMVVSRYEVSYAVQDCGYGMGLLVGSYDDSLEESIKVDQVRMPISVSLSSQFLISIL